MAASELAVYCLCAWLGAGTPKHRRGALCFPGVWAGPPAPFPPAPDVHLFDVNVTGDRALCSCGEVSHRIGSLRGQRAWHQSHRREARHG